MWVRGLKLETVVYLCADTPSHPMWVRGLKLGVHLWQENAVSVAPYVGAWIETYSQGFGMANPFVAPYVGAWIETNPQ